MTAAQASEIILTLRCIAVLAGGSFICLLLIMRACMVNVFNGKNER